MKSKKINWKKYSFEFLSIFIAVISAFALNNWNDNRRNSQAESKILFEILNGLEKDKGDFQSNAKGHELGIESCKFWRMVFRNEKVRQDSLHLYYFILTRDFTTIQNSSGYETLKSKGFEIIDNDSLRAKIISLYEFDYQIIRKLEEEYYEIQFQKNYFKELNGAIASNFEFSPDGNIESINLPINLSESKRKTLLTYLLKIQSNRKYILQSYKDVINKIDDLKKNIDLELKR